MLDIINLRQHPEFLEDAVDYFSSRWNIDRQLYFDSISDSLTTKEPLPRWFLMLRDGELIGGFGLIDNDFMVDSNFSPWLCALYVEPHERGQKLGSWLLEQGVYEAEVLGFSKVYLNTDHVGYFEKYDWRYIGDYPHQSGVDARVYEIDVEEIEEMSAFFDLRAGSYDSHMIDDMKLALFYETIAECFDTPVRRMLDLGCGTGLELEQLFSLYPDMEVTGIDMSQEMLKKLSEKFPGKKLHLICGSFIEEDFSGPFDHVLSTYALHHFSEESKLGLYRKIHGALATGGRFVFGDYTVTTLERQNEILDGYEKRRSEQGIREDELYHYDLPFTVDVELRLMKSAGFASMEIIREWENATIIVATKG